MTRILSILAVVAATALAACGSAGPVRTAEYACSTVNSSVNAESLERDNDGAGEARCANNVEIENEYSADLNDPNWYADE
jgi:predicted small lipoprotein YifL